MVALANPALWFDFAPGRPDLFVVTTKTGVWLVEADGRGGRNLALLVEGEGLEARVSGGSVIVRQGARYWEVEI